VIEERGGRAGPGLLTSSKGAGRAVYCEIHRIQPTTKKYPLPGDGSLTGSTIISDHGRRRVQPGRLANCPIHATARIHTCGAWSARRGAPFRNEPRGLLLQGADETMQKIIHPQGRGLAPCRDRTTARAPMRLAAAGSGTPRRTRNNLLRLGRGDYVRWKATGRKYKGSWRIALWPC